MKKKEYFTSRWGLLLAALGMAIGTGNIWRFPRIAAQNGGATFLIPWIIFLFLWSIPLLITELAIGKSTRMGVVGSFGKLIGKKFTFFGRVRRFLHHSDHVLLFCGHGLVREIFYCGDFR